MHTNAILTNESRTHAHSNYTSTKLEVCRVRRLVRPGNWVGLFCSPGPLNEAGSVGSTAYIRRSSMSCDANIGCEALNWRPQQYAPTWTRCLSAMQRRVVSDQATDSRAVSGGWITRDHDLLSAGRYHAHKKNTKNPRDLDLWPRTFKFKRVLEVVELHMWYLVLASADITVYCPRV